MADPRDLAIANHRWNRRELGIAGEQRAAAHLVARGYRILARNARAGRVELDLVAMRGRLLVIAEVKTRRSRSGGAPEEAVDFRKRERLVRGASAWLAEHPGTRWLGGPQGIRAQIKSGSNPLLSHKLHAKASCA
jgi:putative endonuclease